MLRRTALSVLSSSALSGLGLGSLSACDRGASIAARAKSNGSGNASPLPEASPPQPAAILDVFELGAPPWKTFDPFLFCVHHSDAYPRGNNAMAPDAPLQGRNIGSDFAGKDGWSMYHGDSVPGFPRHPHRGFETVTLARRGFIDHSDSLGATARFGEGDVQWMTAGAGVVHAEMFPLVYTDQDNPTELFQIWLNLPKRDKFVQPYFSMLWSDTIPAHDVADAHGRTTHLVQIAGHYGTTHPPEPPPNSWASHPDADLSIWTLKMQPGARFELPAVGPETQRTLYFFAGESLRVASAAGPKSSNAGQSVQRGRGVRLTPGMAVTLENGAVESEVLFLAARPIGEPVVQRGPFVMNEPEEIVQAYRDYRRTAFGGWPWGRTDPVHAREQGRFAIHADGRREARG